VTAACAGKQTARLWTLVTRRRQRDYGLLCSRITGGTMASSWKLSARSRTMRPILLALAASLAVPSAGAASTYRWRSDVGGNWNDPANWTRESGPPGAGYPNAVGDLAIISTPIDTAQTIAIPDGVTITVTGLVIGDHAGSIGPVTIASTGSGRLVLDSLDNFTFIESEMRDHVISAPIQLNSNVFVNASRVSAVGSLTFTNAISEAGGARLFASNSRGRIRFAGNVPHTYTGGTRVDGGVLELAKTGGAYSITGPLTIVSNAGVVVRCLTPDNIADDTNVIIAGVGRLDLNNQSDVIGAVNLVNGGTVSLGVGATGSLTMSAATIDGGSLIAGAAGSEFRITGQVIGVAFGVYPAQITSSGGVLNLMGAPRPFFVPDGPHAVDLRISAPIVGTGAGLIKFDTGVMLLEGNNTYDGPTTVSAGTLIVNGSQPQNAVSVDGSGATIGGSGTVGAINVLNGTIAPGAAPGRSTGVLSSGAVVIGPGAAFAVEITDAAAGGGYDQLNVIGGVTITDALLTLTAPAQMLPPTATFPIIDNDGNDAVVGTFAGLPEGATISNNGYQFTISYHGGDGNDVVLTNVSPVTYYLSEGATGMFFDEDLLIANPSTVPAPVTLTFQLQGGGTIVNHRIVPAQARLTVHVDDIPGLEAASASVEVLSDSRLPLVVERTMFWDSTRYGGHTANAVRQPERHWLFAEGNQGFFDTYLLIGNANATPADVTVTFMREGELPVTKTKTVAAFSRETVHAADYPELKGRSFGMQIDATLPVTAERAMYFGSTPGIPGAAEPATPGP
jgi:autotransporter-associated beta strand protein